MMPGMYSAISGLEAHQTMLDVTANNLANVDTIGYKAQSTSFVDALSQTLRGGSSATQSNGGQDPEQVGLGVSVGAVENEMGQGSDQSTGNPLDVAIQNNGFFQVESASSTNASGVPTLSASTVQYTRAGNFTVNSSGYLVTQSGQYVVGAAAAGNSGTGQPIQVPTNATNVSIGQNGQVTYDDSTGTQQTAGYLQLANFPNPAGLARAGGSMWTATAASGPASVGTPDQSGFGATNAGELEMSNVDMATEFTNMITAERGYEANSKVITTADQMLQTVVNMPQG
jgi:flagellar hook protein FlgE